MSDRLAKWLKDVGAEYDIIGLDWNEKTDRPNEAVIAKSVDGRSVIGACSDMNGLYWFGVPYTGTLAHGPGWYRYPRTYDNPRAPEPWVNNNADSILCLDGAVVTWARIEFEGLPAALTWIEHVVATRVGKPTREFAPFESGMLRHCASLARTLGARV